MAEPGTTPDPPGHLRPAEWEAHGHVSTLEEYDPVAHDWHDTSAVAVPATTPEPLAHT